MGDPISQASLLADYVWLPYHLNSLTARGQDTLFFGLSSALRPASAFLATDHDPRDLPIGSLQRFDTHACHSP